MRVYQIFHDNDHDIVEAENYSHAVGRWREYNVRNNDMDPDDEPDQIILLSERPVVRGDTLDYTVRKP